MKRLIAILALIAGGIATECVYPLQCSLLAGSSVNVKRRKH
ncbi:hypothetical protein [Paraburkholderia sp.]|nr:hypothetical protein [Paraburkholderia sp.]MDE1180505.1 hypothetical protein [Paraburkholderia sp.]